ncbi:ABC transporter ATP-binding protein [uncultured Phascolarctobacterium sp.]|uniref:ABC transporter ATP-binding protein n=1 Tax=Phascolarctobacterium sp. TaxID=2049039 RepID=UPI0025E4ED91|nr:ABC transporter ATP-binding protein [uncultured Phascolarctobacterium sp.]
MPENVTLHSDDNNSCTSGRGCPHGEIVLEVKNLTKTFAVEGGKVLTACDNVSLQAYWGKTLGIIGESGCGKSTLVRTILQIHPATGGGVVFEGQDILELKGEALRQNRRKLQMVFQDPSAAFNPKMRVKDILCEPLLNYGLLKKSAIDAKAAELLQMVELPVEFKDRYPHSMSGGQRQRLGIARALALEPRVIVCDEATSALDVSVQEKICELLVRLQKEKGITYLFICHDIGLVDLISHQVAVMYLGNVVELLEQGRLSTEGAHPYTKALMKSIFKVDFKPGEKIEPLEGDIPSPLDLPQGCPFQSRCELCQEICRNVKPKLRQLQPGHLVACHLVK